MKKIKKGFTLTEMLITVGIVGIVAALTIPSLTKSANKNAIGASIGRSTQLIETGIAKVLDVAIENNPTLDITNSLCAIQLKDITGSGETFLSDGDDLFLQTTGIMNTEAVSNSYIQKITDYSGSSALSASYSDFNSFPAYRFSKRLSVIIPGTINSENITSYLTANSLKDIPGDVVIQRIFIDANGQDSPNRIGEDVFLFGLTNAGRVVPAGSQAYNNNIYNETIPLYTAACNNSNVTDGRSCAARIMADKWKINY